MAAAAPIQLPAHERLVQTALELLAEEGLEGLGLRSVARRAGLSHGAPLRHFASFAELLSEVAARGFQRLSEALEASAAGLPRGAGPLPRLRAGARAYVACAVANPALFALMFRPELLDARNESYRSHGLAAFERVVVQVRAAQDAGWRAERDTRVLAGAIWASLHGLAALWAQGALAGPVPRASLDDALTTALDLLIGEAPGGSS
jgi:AcrR family transcriptional regulator